MKSGDNTMKNLRDLRGNRLQVEVAKELGISSVALSLYETGRRKPSPDMLAKMAAIYGVTLEEIYEAYVATRSATRRKVHNGASALCPECKTNS